MDVKKQAVINSFGNMVYVAALWVLTIITTQRLGYEATGYLTLAMTIGNLSVAVQLYGVRAFQSSDMSFEYSAKDYLLSRVFTLIIGFVFGLLVCVVRKYDAVVFLCIVLFMLIKSAEAFSDVLYGNVQRVGRLDIAGWCMFARGTLIVILFGLFVWKTNDLNLSLLVTAAACVLLTCVIELLIHNSVISKNSALSVKQIWGIIKDCFPLFIASVIPIVITAYPRIVLEGHYGSTLLGFYGNVSTPSLLITTLVPVVLTAMLPAYGNAYKSVDKRKILKLWVISLIGCLLFGAICFVLMIVLAKPLLSLVYTEQIVPYVKYIYPIIVAMVLYSFSMCNYTALIAIRKKAMIIIAAIVALIICLVLSGVLIKRFAIDGAVAVLIITYLVQFVIQAIFLFISVNRLENKT